MLYKKSALFLVLTYTSAENFANLQNYILISFCFDIATPH